MRIWRHLWPLRLGPLVITTRSRIARSEVAGFELGRKVERYRHELPPEPQPERHLRLV